MNERSSQMSYARIAAHHTKNFQKKKDCLLPFSDQPLNFLL